MKQESAPVLQPEVLRPPIPFSARASHLLVLVACVAPYCAMLPWAIWRGVLSLAAIGVVVHAVVRGGFRLPLRGAWVRLEGRALVWLLWMAAAAVPAFERHLAVHRVVWHGVCVSILLAVMARPALADIRRHAQAIVFAFAGAAALAGAFYLTGVTPGQFCSTLKDQNVLGASLVVLAPLAVYLAVSCPPGPGRTALAAAAALIVLGVLSTESRGAIVGVVLAGTVSLAVGIARTPEAKRAWLLGALITLAFFATPPLLSAMMRVETAPDSFVHRVIIGDASVSMALREPAFGVGPGSFRLAYFSHRPSWLRTSSLLAIPADAHADILDFLAESGFAGLVLTLALGVAVVRTVARAAFTCEDPARRGLASALLGGLVGWMVNGLANSSLNNPALQPMLFAVFGLVGALGAAGPSDRGESPRRSMTSRAAPAVAVLVLGYAAVRVLRTLVASALIVASSGGQNVGYVRLAARVDPTYNVPYQTLGALPEVVGTEAAIAALERSCELVPRYPESHHALGMLLVRAGDRARGVAELRTATGLDPYNGFYLADLAREDTEAVPQERLHCISTASHWLDMAREVAASRYGEGAETQHIGDVMEELARLRRKITGLEGPG